MISAAAPISSEVASFMKIAFGVPVIECYGLTESSSGGFLTSYRDSTSGHVGGPMVGIEFKLVDVPEMNYTV